jgi:hypothetical protein
MDRDGTPRSGADVTTVANARVEPKGNSIITKQA